MLKLQIWKSNTCLNFKHSYMLSIMLLLSFSQAIQAYEYFQHEDEKLPMISRGPATYTTNDDVILIPATATPWTQKILVDDDAGVLAAVRTQIETWQKTENYVNDWDLGSTGLYSVPTQAEKQRYINRHILKYLDKRLSGEVRRADKGSTLYNVGKAQKALTPKAEAGISQNVKIKFKARVLQGKGYVIIDNPYVDADATISVTGSVQVKVEKSLTELGVHSKVQYNVDESVWIAQVDKSITENISASVSSSQDIKNMMFTNDSNQTFQVMYSHAF